MADNPKLTRAERKQIEAVIRKYRGDGKPHTAQDTIPYQIMYPDGICYLGSRHYSQSIEFFDINYLLAQPDDQTAIFEYLCDLYNYLDSSIHVQFTYPNRKSDREQRIYQPYFADPRPENMPILSDLHAALTAQHLPEADRVAQALDLYVSGSLNFFNNRTTVDIDNRFVCFDIKELPKNLKKPGMLVIQDQVWNRVTRNRNTGVSTWYYADEFHLLLKEPQTAAYSAEIWKRFRKWGGVPTGATQNVKDLLSSPEIENILENSDFICMLNQAAGDRKILAGRLNISPEQLKFVTNSPPGEGLLFFENVILPFADKFPRDTELYRIMSTKPSEVNGV